MASRPAPSRRTAHRSAGGTIADVPARSTEECPCRTRDAPSYPSCSPPSSPSSWPRARPSPPRARTPTPRRSTPSRCRSSARAGCSRLTDVAQASNATRTVDCAEKHTAQTYAVGPLPDQFEDADYDDGAIGAWAYDACSKKFMGFLGADESLVMRSLVSWAWFRPSEKAWDEGARWYRCDVVGGGDQTEAYADLPETARGPAARPARRRLDGLRHRSDRDRLGQGPLLAAARLARGDHDQARRAGRPLPGRPAGRR